MRRLTTMLCALAWLACTPRRAPSEATPPMATLTGIRFEYFQGSDLAAVGRAAQVTYERSTGDLTASDVLVRFPSRPDPGALRPAVGGMEVRAPVVVGNLFRKQAEGSRGVVMRTGSGIVARTEKAHIDGQSMKASGKDPVWVDGPSYSLTADSFQSSLQEQEFEFEGRVSSRFGRTR